MLAHRGRVQKAAQVKGVRQEFPALSILTKWKNNLGSRKGEGDLIILPIQLPCLAVLASKSLTMALQSKYRQNRGKYCIYVHK